MHVALCCNFRFSDAHDDSLILFVARVAGGTIVVYTGLLDLLYAREAAYRARMLELGLNPVSMSTDSASAVTTSYAKYFRWPSRAENIPAQAWPWPEHQSDEITIQKGSWQHIRELFNPSAPAQTTPSPKPDTATNKASHSHDLDSRGLRVDRDLLSNQLAVVLGHEVAHALARHSAERLSWVPLIVLLDLVNKRSPLLEKVCEWFVALPYSRLQETEADEIGLTLMARACYHPGVSASFWKDFSGTVSGAHYFSTHPPDDQRAQDAKRWYQAASKEMKRCCA
jgi:hypothetical protein